MAGNWSEEGLSPPLRLRFWFEFRGEGRSGKLFFGKRNGESAAAETREQQIALLRNVPIQGVRIDDVDTHREIYWAWDEHSGSEAAFAPAEVVVEADSLEEVIRFVLREEFRKVEVLEPEEHSLRRYDLERLLFKINAELQEFLQGWKPKK